MSKWTGNAFECPGYDLRFAGVLLLDVPAAVFVAVAGAVLALETTMSEVLGFLILTNIVLLLMNARSF